MANLSNLSAAVEAAKQKASEQLALYLDSRFTDEISSVKWDYPTPPKVRDIVDTGRLRASQTRTVHPDGRITFNWPVEYAQQVHDGGVSTEGMRFPGRPWTRAPLAEAETKFQEFFDAALKEELR